MTKKTLLEPRWQTFLDLPMVKHNGYAIELHFVRFIDLVSLKNEDVHVFIIDFYFIGSVFQKGRHVYAISRLRS